MSILGWIFFLRICFTACPEPKKSMIIRDFGILKNTGVGSIPVTWLDGDGNPRENHSVSVSYFKVKFQGQLLF